MEEKRPSDYASGPPWLFKGSALYQFHLVKAETARALIPKEFKLVEAFGYTLGGLFLADYEDSPAGKFDELVVIAGIVWNPPTSCAWAARVLVNSPEACRHGQKEVGLPSHVGIFSKRAVEIKQPINKCSSLLNMIGIGSNQCGLKVHTEIQISETKASSLMSLCSISFPCDMPNLKTGKKWMGPMIKMSLPSFSGQTIHNPHLLKYSCQIQCRVRPVGAAKISGPTRIDPSSCCDDNNPSDDNPSTNVSEEDNAWNHSISVLLSKPILALEFNLLQMQVEAPTVLWPQSKKGEIGDARAC